MLSAVPPFKIPTHSGIGYVVGDHGACLFKFCLQSLHCLNELTG